MHTSVAAGLGVHGTILAQACWLPPIVSVRFTTSMPRTEPDIRDGAPEPTHPRYNGHGQNQEMLMQSLSTDRLGPDYGRLREKLRAARVEAGLTQGQVGRIVGKPQSFISKIEVGDRGVDFIEIQVLARIYGKSLSYFEDKAAAQ